MTRSALRFALLAAGLALLAAAPARSQQTIKLTAVTAHPPSFLWVKLLDEFYIPEVDKRLAAAGNKHKIEWTKAWAGTLVKQGSEAKSLADGVADIGFVSTVFEASRFPLQNVTYYAPFGSADPVVVIKSFEAVQKAVPKMSEAFTRNGLVYLGGTTADSYHLWTKFPVTKVQDLQGKKIGAPGPAGNWIANTGAVPVAGNFASYYEDIKSGVSDGVLVFATGAWSAKLHEVAPYVTKVNFGAMASGALSFGKARFDRLPPELQKILHDVGELYSERLARGQSEAAATSLQNMANAGAKISELPEVERRRWADALPAIGKTWASDAESKGHPGNEVLRQYMQVLTRAGEKPPRDWSK